MDMFSTLFLVMVSQVYAYVQTHQHVCIKCVQFFVWELYLSKAVEIVIRRLNETSYITWLGHRRSLMLLNSKLIIKGSEI